MIAATLNAKLGLIGYTERHARLVRGHDPRRLSNTMSADYTSVQIALNGNLPNSVIHISSLHVPADVQMDKVSWGFLSQK